MLRILWTISLVCAVALAAGCSAPMQAAKEKKPSPTTTPVAGAPVNTPTTVAKVTAACPLLSAGELRALLGGSSSQTSVTATEDTPDISDGFASYTCKYGSNGRYPFALSVASTQDGNTPQGAIDTIGRASKVPTHSVPGVGAAGVFYTLPDGNSVLAGAKQSHGETRTVLFAAPVVVPEQKLIDVARLVIDRV